MTRVTVALVANDLFFDDFNEPCTAVIVKKITGMPSFCTLIWVLLLGSNDSKFLEIYFFPRVFFFNLLSKILAAFKYLASTFYLFVKKGFLCYSFLEDDRRSPSTYNHQYQNLPTILSLMVLLLRLYVHPWEYAKLIKCYIYSSLKRRISN